jgi:hypothetical protein
MEGNEERIVKGEYMKELMERGEKRCAREEIGLHKGVGRISKVGILGARQPG